MINGAFEIRLEDVEPRLSLSLRSDAGRLGVRVLGTDGRPPPRSWVLVLRAGAQTPPEFSMFLRAGETDTQGGFVAVGLKPGDYWVIATADPPPGEVRLPQESFNVARTPETLGLLMKARGRGQRVTIAPSASAQVVAGVTNWR